MGQDKIQIKRALISVYDKSGLVELGQLLTQAGVEIVSTGSTAAQLSQAGVAVTPVEEVTGFPECLDGRVKTLHPKIHAGILADRRLASHNEQLLELGISAFDLVVTNLYPFAQTVASGADFESCVEQIDIGGPAMVRAAAKNHPSVAVITSPAQYHLINTAITEGGFSLEARRGLAAVAFAHTAEYDVMVANWLVGQVSEEMPYWLGGTWDLADTLRYGENSHQEAGLYLAPGLDGIAKAVKLHGKEMSYNNYADADAAYRASYDFDQPCVAIIKHANPCGIAVGKDIAQAHRLAHACDPISAFGGVISANRPVTKELAEQIAEIFTEVIVAPGYEPGVIDILTKKKNLRILVAPPYPKGQLELKPISGGLLAQEPDQISAVGDDPENWELVAGNAVSKEVLADLAFAWRACRAVKSNAILLAKDGASVGIGMGQVNRVDSCQLAVNRAGDRAAGSVAASDAFFPFSDGPEILLKAGIKAIVQPGGSMRDAETIAACEKAGVALYFTGVRHFFH